MRLPDPQRQTNSILVVWPFLLLLLPFKWIFNLHRSFPCYFSPVFFPFYVLFHYLYCDPSRGARGKTTKRKTNSKCSKHESTVSETRSVFRNGGPSAISVFCPAVLVIYSSFSKMALLELEGEDGKWRAYTLVMTSSIS
ncbi:hypothetical protein CDAR_544451 [Caerostris darwini]|uniref:Uncharacterized protein n=1 Tax=Caerostris darwini TaxID=1538125 RepID=A0AAV4TG11_9ARAC|nr:hypothetical protein CDAR_544451 [Caerostris darwini]